LNIDNCTDRNVSCFVFDSYDRVDQVLETDWDKLALETKSSLYLTCAWSRVWWEFYGNGQSLRIFIFKFHDELVAALPVYIGFVRIGLTKTKVARLVGAYIPPRQLDLPIKKGFTDLVAKKLIQQLIESDCCDVISLGVISGDNETGALLRSALDSQSDGLGKVYEIPSGVKTCFNLPDSYETYLKSLSTSERKKRRYYENLLAKEHELVQAEVRDPAQVDAEMSAFMALHKANWQGQGKLGYFEAWPKSDPFNHRLAVTLAHKGQTFLIKVCSDETPIIYQYGYLFGERFYWELPARASGNEWDRYSLGSTGVLILVRRMIEAGIKHIEAGLHHYEYKFRLGAAESEVFVLRFVAQRTSSRIKYILCRILYRFYLTLYYKIWYSRVQPRLPSILRRSIWMTYIRSII
jgi:hypothetical protein